MSDQDNADQILESIGLRHLAERWMLTIGGRDGPITVQIVEATPAKVTVKSVDYGCGDEYGTAFALGGTQLSAGTTPRRSTGPVWCARSEECTRFRDSELVSGLTLAEDHDSREETVQAVRRMTRSRESAREAKSSAETDTDTAPMVWPCAEQTAAAMQARRGMYSSTSTAIRS